MLIRKSLSRVMAVALLSTGAVVALPNAAGAAGPPVTGLSLNAGYDAVTVTWDFFGATLAEKVVCFAPGAATPAYAGCTEGYRGTDNSAEIGGLTPGEIYTFAVYALDLDGTPSEAATKSLSAAKVSYKVDRTRIIYGDEVTFSGRITDAQTGEGLELPDLAVGAVDAAGNVVGAQPAQGNLEGRWEVTFTPEQAYDYVVAFSGAGERLGAVSSQVAHVTVSSLLLIDPVKKKVKLGKPIQLVVGAAPVDRKKPIVVEQLVKKKWKKILTAKPDADGIALAKLKVKKKGSYSFRSYRPAAKGATAGTSKKVTVKVT